MSETDNFIAEVTEEVRRDRLFGALRRYGWIAGVVIVAVVGGAIWYEVTRSNQTQAAQATGDALLAALESGDEARLSALQSVPAEGTSRVVAALLAANEAQALGQSAQAIALLEPLAQEASMPALYRDLVTFKSLVMGAGVTDANLRREGFEALHAKGGAFGILAYEQLALVELETGNVEAARTIFQAVLADALVSATQRSRVEALLEAIGSSAS